MSFIDTIFPGLGSTDKIMGMLSPTLQQSSSASLLEQLAKKYFSQTNPVRKGLLERSGNFLSGDLDVTQSPMYGTIKAANESQFKTARDNAMASLPQGGALIAALTNLEGDKADSMTKAIGGLASDEMNRATGFVNPQPAFAGLGMAGQIQSNEALAQAQQNSAVKQSLGQGIGMMAGGK